MVSTSSDTGFLQASTLVVLPVLAYQFAPSSIASKLGSMRLVMWEQSVTRLYSTRLGCRHLLIALRAATMSRSPGRQLPSSQPLKLSSKSPEASYDILELDTNLAQNPFPISISDANVAWLNSQ